MKTRAFSVFISPQLFSKTFSMKIFFCAQQRQRRIALLYRHSSQRRRRGVKQKNKSSGVEKWCTIFPLLSRNLFSPFSFFRSSSLTSFLFLFPPLAWCTFLAIDAPTHRYSSWASLPEVIAMCLSTDGDHPMLLIGFSSL